MLQNTSFYSWLSLGSFTQLDSFKQSFTYCETCYPAASVIMFVGSLTHIVIQALNTLETSLY